MSQINIKKTASFFIPPDGARAWSFDALGNPGIIKEDGAFVKIPLEADENGVSANILANRGVGLLADLPTDPVDGDIYVTSDTLQIHYRVDDVSWSLTPLVKSQLVTDSSNVYNSVYQFDGVTLCLIINAKNQIIRSAKTAVLQPGTHTIAFSSPLPDTNYINIVQGYTSAGKSAPPEVKNETVNGFDVVISIASSIRYKAGYE